VGVALPAGEGEADEEEKSAADSDKNRDDLNVSKEQDCEIVHCHQIAIIGEEKGVKDNEEEEGFVAEGASSYC
jgi:hypothetical protein